MTSAGGIAEALACPAVRCQLSTMAAAVAERCYRRVACYRVPNGPGRGPMHAARHAAGRALADALGPTRCCRAERATTANCKASG
jgi:hypothetical protein